MGTRYQVAPFPGHTKNSLYPIPFVMDFHDIFARFIANREWDVTEMSFAKFVTEVTRADSDVIGLPVFIRRAFRFGFIFVNRKKGVTRPEDLRGKRIGIPEWGQTATVYMRGWLQHNVGIPLSEIDWVQAGTNEPGRLEPIDMTLPAGVRHGHRYSPGNYHAHNHAGGRERWDPWTGRLCLNASLRFCAANDTTALGAECSASHNQPLPGRLCSGRRDAHLDPGGHDPKQQLG